jgi:cyclase
MRPRIIPCLLLKGKGLVKTVRFKNPTYVGDFINAVKIFNDKQVDELVFLDITATVEHRKPPLAQIAKITEECFMPLAYGGGIRELADIKQLLNLGVEKVCLNACAVENPALITAAANLFGSQSIVVSIDARKTRLAGYRVFTHSGTKNTHFDPIQFAMQMERAGAGELFLTAIDRDGTMQGYDLELIQSVAQAVTIPVIACGGAGSLDDMARAISPSGASAAAAGSLFVFQGKHRAVLITYPSPRELQKAFEKNLD